MIAHRTYRGVTAARLAAAGMLLLAVLAPSLRAQLPRAGREVVRGRVTTDGAAPVVNARVTAVALPSKVTRDAATDSSGRYEIVFPSSASAEYEVSIRVVGRAPFQKRVPRRATDSVLVVDAILAAATPTLAAVKVQAARRSKPPVQDNNPADVGGASQMAGSLVLAQTDRGDLTMMAASIPGVTLVPGTNGGPPGFSVLGIAPSQNAVTLNGLSFGGNQLPAGAYTSTRLQTSAYDPSVGGFSGGLLSTTLMPGGNYGFGSFAGTVDDPALQWTDPAGTRLGQRYRNILLGGSRTGPLIRDKLYFNVSGQVGRRTNDVTTLVGADASALEHVGVSPGSNNQLIQTLNSLHVPLSVESNPDQTVTKSGTALGRFDILPTSTRTLYLLAGGTWRQTTPTLLGPTAMPSMGGTLRTWNGNLQGEYARYILDYYLTRIRTGVSQGGNTGTPLTLLPHGQVLVGSALESGRTGLANLEFGGSSTLPQRTRTRTWETTFETSWFLPDNAHRPKIAAAIRFDDYRSEATANGLGTFAFTSLADLTENRPASFTRTLAGGAWRSRETSAWASAGDVWRKTDRFALQYGVRWEGNRYGVAPAYNPLVDSLFGVRTSSVPHTTHLSPRVGFTWAYGRDPQVSASARPRGQFRGGVGEFRSTLSPTLIGPALAGTGLADALQRITCIGPAAPIPDWEAFARDPATIPTACADGGTGAVTFADARAPVTLFAPDYRPGRAWRGNLGWSGRFLHALRLSADAIYSVNLDQPSTEDLNFAGVPGFVLANEGRPVFVDPDRIDPASGGIDPLASRLTPQLSRVASLGSDLQSRSAQLSLSLAPGAGISISRYWGLSYTYARVRDQSRGFDGAAFGDPRPVTWGTGATDIRHSLSGWLTFALGEESDGSLNLSAQLRSGAPFTPLVRGDVNGDGLVYNDRAFVFDPATAGDSALALGMTRLLNGAPTGVRECLTRQLDHAAERNSCRGPWTLSSYVTVGTSGRRLGLTDRAWFSFMIANPIAGLDQLLHGESGLRGWGQPAMPDPMLLAVNGFTPGTQRFRYAVNPAFGDTRPGRSTLRSPFQITMSVSLRVNAPFSHQQLDDVMAPGRFRGGDRLTASQIALRYAGSNLDPVRPLLAAKDSLLLTGEQAARLAEIGKRYTAATDAAWTRLAKYLAPLDREYDRAEALQQVRSAKDDSYAALIIAARAIRELLTPEQVALLATELQQMLDERSLERLRRTELRSYR